MRKLIITRRSSSIGSLRKFTVYISDSRNPELKICDVKCRKLGVIRDGETLTFDIDNDVNRLFVIGSKRMRNTCCDSVHIFSGSDDVEFDGTCKFNPARLNPFVFDGEPDEMARRYRNVANLKGVLTILGLVAIAVIIGTGIYALPF
jgi:hypothetical protein